LGGGTWAVERQDGSQDLLTIRDFRVLVGYERNVKPGVSGKLEAGFVFGRKIEFNGDAANLRAKRRVCDPFHGSRFRLLAPPDWPFLDSVPPGVKR